MNVYAYTFTRRKVAESPATIRTPRDSLPVIRALVGAGAESERLVVLWLNTRNHVIGAEVVYVGNVASSLVRVGEVFRGAVRVNATTIIVAHNHPSGDPTPSPDDLHLTAEVIAAGRLLDIEVLDHIVVTDDDHVSLRDRGVSFEPSVRSRLGG